MSRRYTSSTLSSSHYSSRESQKPVSNMSTGDVAAFKINTKSILKDLQKPQGRVEKVKVNRLKTASDSLNSEFNFSVLSNNGESCDGVSSVEKKKGKI